MHQIIYDQLAKQSLMKGPLRLGAEGHASSLDLRYEMNKDVNERERHNALVKFKYNVSSNYQAICGSTQCLAIQRVRVRILTWTNNLGKRPKERLDLLFTYYLTKKC